MQLILWEIGILSFLLWALAVGFVLFTGILFYRQQQIFHHILKRLKQMEKMIARYEENQSTKKQQTPQVRLSIPKDEPISKYESMTLPDDVQISCVEK